MNIKSASFVGSSDQTMTRTVNDLANQFKGISSKHDDRSLRVYEKGVTKEGEKTLVTKLHTGFTLFISKDSRAKRRENAVHVVKVAIRNQLGSKNMVEAEQIFKKVCGDDAKRVSFGDLKKIQQEVQSRQVEQAPHRAKTLLNKFLKGDSFSLDDFPAPHLTKDAIKNLPEIRDLVTESKNKNTESFQKLFELFQKLDPKEPGVWNKLAGKYQVRKQAEGDKVWENAGGDSVYNEVCAGIKESLDEVVQSITLEYLEKTPPPKFEPIQENGRMPNNPVNKPGLTELANLKGWFPATNGTNGALIILNSGLSGGGNIIKGESSLTTKVNENISQYIESVKNNLGDDVLPVDGMKIGRLDLDKESMEKIEQQINKKLGDDNSLWAKNIREKVDNMKKGALEITSAEFISNAIDFKNMNVGERANLCRTDTLPKSLGGAMILSKLFGLGDHVSISDRSYDTEQQDNNLSNLMMNKHTGKLTFIDYAFVDGNRGGDVSGYTANNIKSGFDLVVDLAKAIHNKQGKVESLFEGLALNGHDGNKPFLSGGCLNGVLSSVFVTSRQGHMFTPDENGAIQSLSQNTKSKFALNILLGAIDALKLIDKHPQAFTGENAMCEDPQGVVNHVHSLVQSLGGVEEGLKKMLAELN